MTVTAEERQAFLDFDATLGPNYRAELIAGRFIVTPPPNGNHESVIGKLTVQMVRKSAVDITVSGNRGLDTPFGNFIPDLTVAEPGSFDDEPSWGLPAGILLLAEVTSDHSSDDRVTKRRAYAAAGVPLYLLVDRDSQETVLFSQPDVEARDYRADIRVPFGSDLELPAPFSFTLTDFTPRAD
ncbi:Uma2 family endonuclease [Catenulispora rubra]|uniref:Uma2 family endonuclease n=1 Tax=Catenulispora rubra TaxID=280293 RepID=UPI0018920614|nr:Uma2 family endonuclease [Catenulispora rubra]